MPLRYNFRDQDDWYVEELERKYKNLRDKYNSLVKRLKDSGCEHVKWGKKGPVKLK